MASTSSSTSSGTSEGAGISFIAGANFGLSQGASSSSTDVPVFQRRQFCNQVEQTMHADQAQAISSMFESFATLAARASTLVQDAAAVQQASADGAIALEQVSLASATASLEAEQTAATQVSQLPLYRQVHNFDAWEAQALLDAARVAAVTARRAIESHYVVDMSALTSPEAFVGTPKGWADSVYQYDSSLPAAVGLDVSTGLTGTDLNAVQDYSDNLTRFVSGFSVTRPTAVASDDVDILTLPGPLGLATTASATGANAGAGAAWSYLCPASSGNGTVWQSLPSDGNPNDACGSLGSNPRLHASRSRSTLGEGSTETRPPHPTRCATTPDGHSSR